MPTMGRQPNPLILTVAGKSTNFTSHAMNALDDDNISSMRPFLEPAIRAINQLSYALPGLPIYMVGLSGGGWTTEFIRALDIRIRNGYSVFGSMPWEILDPNADTTDSEQYKYNPAYLKGALHVIRYALGGDHGRRAINIWGDGDTAWPATTHHATLAAKQIFVQQLLGTAGTFDLHYDTAAAVHQYTDQTLAFIRDDINAFPTLVLNPNL